MKEKTLFIDASKEYNPGKNQNELGKKHIDRIVETYSRFRESDIQTGIVEEKYSYVASFDELQENDFNLNIPRYVDTFEEEEDIDIPAVQGHIKKLEGELAAVQSQMRKYLEELNLNG
ncbi:type I restriction-modification system [Nonlabens ulvanivorans]|uniref:site-specific DNA-methyltransferase (adenine-specific) n=1 Tax=Nonlabens ulvanivorans TaxID=906888 RepID=A0A081D6D0_NONUL|nr:SAM-dependent methyltransferase [Nonlabens ulvanivorans]GAK74476.1 type I restriction-modification system [Nonlabens ulvanivorans]